MIMMDINDLRSLMTVVSFVAFVAIVWWAYSRGPQRRFEEAAALPFTEDDEPRPVARRAGQTE